MDHKVNTADAGVNRKLLYGLAFLIPVCMMTAVYIGLGAYPFGERSILVSDLRTQFVDYYSYFKSIFTGNNDFIYTFSKNMGGDMIGFSGYYLQNPLNLLLLLFPQDMVSVAIMVIVALQLGISGLCFSLFANQIYKPSYGTLLFSTSYAFMGYVFAYFTLPIYFANIAIMPLVILGLHRLMEHPKKKWLYVFSLAASLFFNYYMGYMLCLFTVMYFAYLLLLRVDSLRRLKEYTGQIISYVTGSLLAAGLAAWDLIPIALSLSGQKNAPEASVLQLYRKFKMSDAFTQLYANVFNGNVSNDTFPYIYVGAVAVFFAGLYLTSKAVSRKEKLLSLGLFVSVMVCMYINTLDVIFHAFNEPVGFAYRYAWLAAFVLVLLALKGFHACTARVEKKQVLLVFAIFLLYTAYLLATGNGWVGMDQAGYELILFAAISVVLLLCMGGVSEGRARIGFLLLGGVAAIELTGNAVHSISQYPASTMEEYASYIHRVEPAVTYVKEQDDGFYRMEKNFERTHNDAMQFQYNGLTHFSSCEKDMVRTFASRMGFRTYGQWAWYNLGGTTFADNFLGVKYFLSKYSSTGKPFEAIHAMDDIYIYQNPYALPLGFGVSEAMEHADMENSDLFEIQNSIARGFGDETLNIYTPAEGVTEQLVNAERADLENGVIQYRKLDGAAEAYVEYTIPVTNENMLFLFWNGPRIQGAEVFVNDASYDAYFTNTKWDMLEVGSYRIGEQVKVKILMKEETLDIYDYLFYYENRDELLRWHEVAAAMGTADLRKITSSHLKGSITLGEDASYLLFTIPYERDWQVRIDGERVETVMLLDALLAVPAAPGEHTISMRYVPRGFYAGIPVSLFAALCCVWGIVRMRKRA